MKARVEELENKNRKYKKHRSTNKMGISQSRQELCLSLPIHLEKEEIIVMSKAGSIFDDGIVKDAVLLGFATSRRVGDDAVNKIIRSLETYTTRKVNIVTYERARPDNSLKREAPEEYIELQVRGLVFNIWSSR